MTITNGYLTVDDITDAFGGFTAGTVYTGQIERSIEAASRLIDEWCGRRFWVDGSDVTRYYTATAPARLSGIDVVTVTSLSTDPTGARTYATSWDATDYDLEPYNAAADGWPYTSVRTAPTAARTFPTVSRGVKIVGTFGWPAVPTAIVEATKIQLQRLYRRKDSPLGIVDIPTADGSGMAGMQLRSRLDPDVRDLIAPYRRLPAVVA